MHQTIWSTVCCGSVVRLSSVVLLVHACTTTTASWARRPQSSCHFFHHLDGRSIDELKWADEATLSAEQAKALEHEYYTVQANSCDRAGGFIMKPSKAFQKKVQAGDISEEAANDAATMFGEYRIVGTKAFVLALFKA